MQINHPWEGEGVDDGDGVGNGTVGGGHGYGGHVGHSEGHGGHSGGRDNEDSGDITIEMQMHIREKQSQARRELDEVI